MGVLTKHMFVDPPPFADANLRPAEEETSRLLGALETVTRRALAKKPEQRFQTMAALAAELEQTVSFPESGGVRLAHGWSPPVSQRSARQAGGGGRAFEGPDGAAIRASGDLPVVPETSWRSSLLAVGGILVLAVLVGSLALARHNVARQPSSAAPSMASASASAAPVAQAAPPTPMLRTLHLTTTPPFAEVWQDGRRIGTTPMDLTTDPTAPPTRCTVRASGYAGRDLVIDSSAGPSMDITLEKVAPPPVVPPTRKTSTSPSTRRRPASSDGELVDPFSR